MFLRIRSRNGSAAALRRQVQTTKRGVYRCGSLTSNNEIFTREELRRGVIEINTVEASKISNNKTEMKKRFDAWHVPTAEWTTIEDIVSIIHEQGEMPFSYPFIIKHNHSSQGNGIYMIPGYDELVEFLEDPPHRHNHIVEHYYTYVREYRLHVDRFGCFCANRKMLREDAEVRWHRHHSNSNWIREDNELFDRPVNWDAIVAAAQLARKSVGLDICSVDVKIQSSRQETPKFFILETNSGSALGEQTTPLYIEELTRICAAKSAGDEESFVLEEPDNTTDTTNVVTTPIDLSAEETESINSVMNSVTDTPAVVTNVNVEKGKKKLKCVCPHEFEGCEHIIWTGEKYGCCDLNEKPCPLFVIDTESFDPSNNEDDDEDYDENYDEEDDWYDSEDHV